MKNKIFELILEITFFPTILLIVVLIILLFGGSAV